MSSLPRICRFVFAPIALVVIAFAGDRIGAILIDRVMMGTKFRYSQMYNGELSASIVVLGNSRGLHMFHPPAIEQVTNVDAANISFNALPTVVMPDLWDDYLTHNRIPKKLLFEVSCVNRKDQPGALERFTAYMSHSPSLTDSLRQYRPTAFYVSQVSHLYRYNGEFPIRSLFFRHQTDQGWIMRNTASTELIDRMLEIGVEEIVYDLENVAAAKEILNCADERDVAVELIIGPFHPRYREAMEGLPAWRNWFEQQLGCDVRDYSDAITAPEAFADHMHLNPHGSMLFAQRLRQDGLLGQKTTD